MRESCRLTTTATFPCANGLGDDLRQASHSGATLHAAPACRPTVRALRRGHDILAAGPVFRGLAVIHYFRMLTRPQLHAYLAALGGWSLDALDFFVFAFSLSAISTEFHTTVKAVSEGIFLTLACRPAGALVFGWLAEKYGRRPILMLNVVSYSVVQFATAFAPDLATLLVLRAVFGFAMGGEWGVGAALALETLPPRNPG